MKIVVLWFLLIMLVSEAKFVLIFRLTAFLDTMAHKDLIPAHQDFVWVSTLWNVDGNTCTKCTSILMLKDLVKYANNEKPYD